MRLDFHHILGGVSNNLRGENRIDFSLLSLCEIFPHLPLSRLTQVDGSEATGADRFPYGPCSLSGVSEEVTL